MKNHWLDQYYKLLQFDTIGGRITLPRGTKVMSVKFAEKRSIIKFLIGNQYVEYLIEEPAEEILKKIKPLL